MEFACSPYSSEVLSVNLLPGGDEVRAKEFSERFALSLNAVSDISQLNGDYVLQFSAAGAAIHTLGKAAPGPVDASFIGGKNEHRRKFGGGKGQLVAKAVGLKSGIYPHVCDATAGLGRDSFVLATLGCDVTMVERSPVVSELLFSALNKANGTDVETICSRMKLIHANSYEWLNSQAGPVADVIYLDPMYPHRDKSALVKKEMRIFRDLVGGDEDASNLLVSAIDKAAYRVVVKRPKKGELLEGPKPNLQLESKGTRYDIYTKKSMDGLRRQ